MAALLFYAVAIIGAAIMLSACDRQEQAKKRQAEADELRRREKVQRQIEERIQDRLAKEAQSKADLDTARASVKLKDWSFQITRNVHGLLVNEPVVFLEYTITNPTKYWLMNAKWSLSFLDARGERIGNRGIPFTLRSFHTGKLNHVRPGTEKKDNFIFGFKDLGFSPRLVEGARFSLVDFELKQEMPESEKEIAREQEKEREAVEEAKRQVEEAKRQAERDKIRSQRETARKVFEFYSQRATNGDGSAQFRVAQLYLSGQGVETNIEQARFWLFHAATNGQADAANLLNSLQTNR